MGKGKGPRKGSTNNGNGGSGNGNGNGSHYLIIDTFGTIVSATRITEALKAIGR